MSNIIEHNFTCPNCGNDELIAMIVVESCGHGPTGMHGPPEFSSPGEGPEYYLRADVTCDGVLDEDAAQLGDATQRCGRVFDDDYFHTGKEEDKIIERIGEKEYDYDGPDTLEEYDD